MTYLSIFWEFLKIGTFAFGGAYGAIPLIKESVLAHGWMDEAMFANIVALSESTPGPIMVNAATYIGSSQGGVFGALIATLGIVLPSFIIILLITKFLRRGLKHPKVQAILHGVKPCLMGVILATGCGIAFHCVFTIASGFALDMVALVILLVLIFATIIWPRVRKTEISPILLILISAVLGAALY